MALKKSPSGPFSAVAVVIALSFCSLAFGQEKSKIAFYITGTGDPAKDHYISVMFEDALVKEYSYYFRPIDRNEAFLDMISKEHKKARSGAIDDKQIIQMGMQAGAEYMCIGNIAAAFGSNMLNARITNVKTAEIIASGRSNVKGELEDADVLESLLSAVIKSMGKDLLKNFK